MYIIKCKDLIETIPAEHPHPEIYNGKWHAFVFRYATLERAIGVVNSQKNQVRVRPMPERKYRIYEQQGRKLNLVWED